MLVLQLFVVIAVSAVDPIAIVLYGAAAFFAKTWRQAASFGLLAGVALVALTLVLSSANGRQPQQLHLLAQIIACIAGAAAIRAVINGLRSTDTAS